MAEHTVDINPDFRPVPKTDRYCYVCSRDLAPGTVVAWIRVDEVDPHGAIRVGHLPGVGEWFMVGPDCAKTIERRHGAGIVFERPL